MQRLTKFALVVLAAPFVAAGLGACDRNESAGDVLDDAIDTTGEAIEDAGEAIQGK